jgi:hypothetical protein
MDEQPAQQLQLAEAEASLRGEIKIISMSRSQAGDVWTR